LAASKGRGGRRSSVAVETGVESICFPAENALIFFTGSFEDRHGESADIASPGV